MRCALHLDHHARAGTRAMPCTSPPPRHHATTPQTTDHTHHTHTMRRHQSYDVHLTLTGPSKQQHTGVFDLKEPYFRQVREAEEK